MIQIPCSVPLDVSRCDLLGAGRVLHKGQRTRLQIPEKKDQGDDENDNQVEKANFIEPASKVLSAWDVHSGMLRKGGCRERTKRREPMSRKKPLDYRPFC